MKKKIEILALIIIIIGIILVSVKGLVFDLNYSENEQLEIKIGTEFDLKDINQIAKEVFNKQKFKINKSGEGEESVSIRLYDYTDDQLLQLNEKINEKYSLENKVEDIEKYHNTNVRGRDIIKHFIISIAISTIIISIYVMIKYKKLNSLKVLAQLLIGLILSQMFILSIYSITRLPISRITMSIAIIVYLIVITIFVSKKEKELEELNFSGEEN